MTDLIDKTRSRATIAALIFTALMIACRVHVTVHAGGIPVAIPLIVVLYAAALAALAAAGTGIARSAGWLGRRP